jgi:predicted transcriptional regulator
MYPAILQSIANNLRNRPEKYSIRTISNLLTVSKSTIHRWVNRKVQLSRKRKIKSLNSYEKIVRDYVKSNPACRLKDLKELFVDIYDYLEYRIRKLRFKTILIGTDYYSRELNLRKKLKVSQKIS